MTTITNEKAITQTINTVGIETPKTIETHITTDNIVMLSEKIAAKALLQNLARGNGLTIAEYHEKVGKGENPCKVGQYTYLHNIYCKLISDIRRRKATNDGLFAVWQPTDGYDIVQEVGLYLQANIGKALTDNDPNGELLRDGKPCDIWRAAFRAANRFIMSERRKQSKTVYLDDYSDGGERLFIAVPKEWGIESEYDYKVIVKIIAELKLTEVEKRFLSLRMKGKSLTECAKAMSVKPDSIKNYKKRIHAKVAKCETLAPYLENLEKHGWQGLRK